MDRVLVANEMNGVLGHNSALRLYWARDNLNHAPGVELMAQAIDQ